MAYASTPLSSWHLINKMVVWVFASDFNGQIKEQDMKEFVESETSPSNRLSNRLSNALKRSQTLETRGYVFSMLQRSNSLLRAFT